MTSVLESLQRRAAAGPDRIAIRGGAQTLTYRELHALALRLARLLRKNGVRVLAIAADNSPDWVVVDIAAQVAGATVVPLPLFFSDDQLRHVIDHSGADTVVLDAAAAPRTAGLGGHRIECLTTRLELWRLADRGDRGPRPKGIAKISYTSGTTGTPKGVCLTQATLDRVATSLCAATSDVAIESHLCLLPLATLLENVAGVYAPILRGATITLPCSSEVGLRDATRLDIDRLIACLAAEQPHSVIVLPQMLMAMVTAAERGAVLPRSLRFIAVGGACVATPVLERAERLGLPVYEGYGLTECASVVALNTPGQRRIGSVGRPLAHVDIRIGAGSEIFVGGASMLGYRTGIDKSPDRKPSSLVSEIATGDIGHLDTDGYLYVTGRRKNVFITSFGRNVSPDWIEARLTGTDAIAQAGLFGEARPWNVAVIVPRRRDVNRERIEANVAGANASLPAYAQVHQWILADEPFSQGNGLLTANGRNRRQAIWSRYCARINACYEQPLSSCA